jgi:serine/threonine protein kinase
MLAETKNGKFCAIKSIKKEYIFKNNEIRHILSEKETLYKLNNCFCMKLFTEFEDNSFVYFVMEYLSGGELKTLLRESGKFGVERTRFYMAELFCAIEYMHSEGIVHRHLCPENILIDETGHIKLADFGSSIRTDYHLNGKLYTICCSAGYLSPEQMNAKFDGGYGKEVDWWTYGIIFYELMTGKTPFIASNTDNKYEILMRLLRHKLKFPGDFDKQARDIITKLLNPNLEARLKHEKEIKQHEFWIKIKPWKDIKARKLAPPDKPLIGRIGDSSNFKISEGSAKHWKLGLLENKVHMF